jgi:hypothetical protein
MLSGKLSQKRREELAYLNPLSYSAYNKNYVRLIKSFDEQKTEFLAEQLEPRGMPIFIKGAMQAGYDLEDKIDKVIKAKKIDANAYTAQVCNCDSNTAVQLYKIKKLIL